jgi:hypothetical protein
MTVRRRNALQLAAALPPAARVRLLRTAPPGLTSDALVAAYLDEKQGVTAIARRHGCRVSTVVLHLALNGIPLRAACRRSSWRAR